MPDKIPKIIHYCWFGGNPLPESAKRCIESWKKFCPDYEIKRWDETNYDVNLCEYSQDAYEAKQWAFVSDYARFYILRNEGGIYLDTDVELIRPLDDLLDKELYMGCEVSTDVKSRAKSVLVNPGLGFGAVKDSQLLGEIIEYYQNLVFKGNPIKKTIGEYVTEILEKKGFEIDDKTQQLTNIVVYASEYFSPLNNMTGEIKITDNTRSIHHYDGTWMNASGKIAIYISRKTQNRNKAIRIIGAVASIPFRLINRVQTNGFKNTVKYIHSDL